MVKRLQSNLMNGPWRDANNIRYNRALKDYQVLD